ncbi:MAG: acylphosphatase [Nanoarchaeota archaeon]
MKKSVRLLISGSLQPMFYNEYIKKNADILNLRGYLRNLEDGRVEVFLEGDMKAIEEMLEVCKQGPYNTQIRNIERKEERYQDFKDFRVMRI